MSVALFITVLVAGRSDDGPNLGAGFAIFSALATVVAALIGYGLLIPMRRGPRIFWTVLGVLVLLFATLALYLAIGGLLEEIG